MALDGRVHGQRVAEVHGRVRYGSGHPRGTGRVPAYPVLAREGDEVVFLVVVEVWFEGSLCRGDSGVGFFLWGGRGAEVDSVVFCAGLEEDPFREGGGGCCGEG